MTESEDADVIDRLYQGGEDPDGLSIVRALVARVREEHEGVEPPQAISARLLQAAEEHAPKRAAVAVEAERPGLWARIRGWMMPATIMVGAAAALVLWVKQDRPPAEPTTHRPATPAAETKREEMKEVDGTGAGTATCCPAPDLVPEGEVVVPPPEAEEPKAPQAKPKKQRVAAKPADDARPSGGQAVAIDEGGADADKADEAPPPPPPPPANDSAGTEETVAQEAAPPPDTSTVEKKAPVTKTKPKSAAQLTSEAQIAAQKGDCKRVATLGAQVKAMDAAYYRDHFESDAEIRRCRK